MCIIKMTVLCYPHRFLTHSGTFALHGIGLTGLKVPKRISSSTTTLQEKALNTFHTNVFKELNLFKTKL